MCFLFIFSTISDGTRTSSIHIWFSLHNVAMMLGLKDTTLTCITTGPNQISTAVGPLCQKMPWRLKISWCSAGFYVGSKMLKITLAHLTADTKMVLLCVQPSDFGVRPIRQSAICSSVKVSDYYTADSSSWMCVRLTTVSSNPDSLNQKKHLGSIMPCWKPLIVNSQSTLSWVEVSTELCANALF